MEYLEIDDIIMLPLKILVLIHILDRVLKPHPPEEGPPVPRSAPKWPWKEEENYLERKHFMD